MYNYVYMYNYYVYIDYGRGDWSVTYLCSCESDGLSVARGLFPTTPEKNYLALGGGNRFCGNICGFKDCWFLEANLDLSLNLNLLKGSLLVMPRWENYLRFEIFMFSKVVDLFLAQFVTRGLFQNTPKNLPGICKKSNIFYLLSKKALLLVLSFNNITGCESLGSLSFTNSGPVSIGHCSSMLKTTWDDESGI